MPPKFGSLDALKKGGSGSDDDEKEQKFFVGGMGQGGGGSGQNVIDPAKMMDRVREMGGVAASDHEAGSSSAFVGSGYSLSGSGAEPAERNEDERKIRHTITFYKNGFVVDDGPLRSLHDPENAPFLNDINQGRTPAEFAGERDPFVSIINKAGEDFTAPARPVAFAGSGQALGGGGAAAAAGPVQAATVTFSVNDSEPTTTIQIRLHDGTRIQQVFNHTHTVGDVYNWVSTATPNAQFDLLNSFPRKKLEDRSETIAAAGLQNAALTQALK